MVMRPLEPDELLERCDLAGEAVVLTVRPGASGARRNQPAEWRSAPARRLAEVNVAAS